MRPVSAGSSPQQSPMEYHQQNSRLRAQLWNRLVATSEATLYGRWGDRERVLGHSVQQASRWQSGLVAASDAAASALQGHGVLQTAGQESRKSSTTDEHIFAGNCAEMTEISELSSVGNRLADSLSWYRQSTLLVLRFFVVGTAVISVGAASSFVGRYIWIMRSLGDGDESGVLRLLRADCCAAVGFVSHSQVLQRPTSRSIFWTRRRPVPNGKHGGCCGPTFGSLMTVTTHGTPYVKPGFVPRKSASRSPALAVVAADRAVTFSREHWNPRAVETPWQRRYVAHFTAD